MVDSISTDNEKVAKILVTMELTKSLRFNTVNDVIRAYIKIYQGIEAATGSRPVESPS